MTDPADSTSRLVPDPEALLQLRILPGLGDRTMDALLRHSATEDELLRRGWEHARAWAGRRGGTVPTPAGVEARVRRIRERCGELGARWVIRGREGYPEALERLPDPPHVLFLRGNSGLLDTPSVAVVGARRATAYGRRMAERIAGELAQAGVPVLSGLALGIDGAAHRGALEGGGHTAAVLGSGVDVPHPPSHRSLFRRLVQEGLVLTEFLPGTPPRAHHFPRRNRILAALAPAVVVVEAARGSGALITANQALGLGGEVLAVPGNAEDPGIQGNLDLFRDGARVAAGARDVFRALGWDWPEESGGGNPAHPSEASARAGEWGGSGSGARAEDDLILTFLAERGPQPLDVIVREVGLPPPTVLARLSTLEVDGRVVQRTGGVVALARRVGGVGAPTTGGGP